MTLTIRENKFFSGPNGVSFSISSMERYGSNRLKLVKSDGKKIEVETKWFSTEIRFTDENKKIVLEECFSLTDVEEAVSQGKTLESDWRWK